MILCSEVQRSYRNRYILPRRYYYINNPSVRIDHLCFVIQLSDGVSVIGREDFPDKWTNLLPVCDFFNFQVTLFKVIFDNGPV